MYMSDSILASSDPSFEVFRHYANYVQVPNCDRHLKMRGLYIYTLKIDHKSCNMLSILNKVTLQKELQSSVTNSVLWATSKNTTTTKQKIKHKTACWSRALNPGLHPKRIRYHCTIESTESINCSQAI